jgi:hypothetical protein
MAVIFMSKTSPQIPAPRWTLDLWNPSKGKIMKRLTFKSLVLTLLLLASASASAEYDDYGYRARQEQAAHNARIAAQAYRERQEMAAQNSRIAAQAYRERQEVAAQNARIAAQAYRERQEVAAQNARNASQAYRDRQNASSYGGSSYYGGSSSYSSPSYSQSTPRYVQAPQEYYGGGEVVRGQGSLYVDEYGQVWRLAPSAQPAQTVQSEVVQAPQEYESIDYSASARLKLTVPKGSQVKFDGNTVTNYDGKIDMSWSEPRPKNVKEVKIEITLDKDGFLYTLNYPATIKTGTVANGSLDFTDPKVRDQVKAQLTVKDRYAETLAAKTKDKKDSLDAWHKTQGETLARRDAEIETWHAGLIKSLANEPEQIRSALTPSIDQKRDEAMGAVDSATALFTEEFARRKKVVEEGAAKVISLRASGTSMTEVEKVWAEALKESDQSEYIKKLDTVLSTEKRDRSEYPLPSLLGKERTIHNYLSTTLATWKKGVESTVASWKSERIKDTVDKTSAEIKRWSTAEMALIAKVEDPYIRELAQKAHEAELEKRRKLIAVLEADIETEATRRLGAYQTIYDAYAKEFREKQVIKEAKATEAETVKSEDEHKSAFLAALAAVIDTEKKRQAEYTPAEKLIQSETGIRDYRIAKQKELDGISQQIDQKANALLGDRVDLLAKWKETTKQEVSALVHKPVRATIEKVAAQESKLRTAYEAGRSEKIELFRSTQKAAFAGFFERFVKEYRQNENDARIAPDFAKAIAGLKALGQLLDESLALADSSENERRIRFGRIADQAKAEEARYPLAVSLPKSAAGKYFLGYELNEKHSLYSLNEAGERKLLATFDEGGVHDAVATEGSLVLLAKGIRQIPAERGLTDASNVQPEAAIDSAITTLLAFQDGKLALVHQPELAGGVYRRVWLDETGAFLVNLEKEKEIFTLQLEKDASAIDIVETKEAKSQEAGLFQRSP